MPKFVPYPHQLEALEKLREMEKGESKGGFLADSPGMGKGATIAMHLKNNKIPKKPDLIICPKSTLSVWKFEIKRVNKDLKPRIKPHILIYHGVDRDHLLESRDNWDYVITTYQTASANNKIVERFWGRVVLDESHTIKNAQKKKLQISTIFTLTTRSHFRYCVSATPFNNNISDIASQAHFIGTQPYNEKSWWNRNKHNKILLKEWNRKFVIRRTKENLLVPPLYREIVVNPTRIEFDLVEILRKRTQEKFEEWKKAKATKNDTKRIKLQAEILGLITRLRQFSNSFYCVEKTLPDAKDIRNSCAKVDNIINTLAEMLDTDKKNGVVMFSQFTSFLDILEKIIKSDLPEADIYRIDGENTKEQRDMAIKNFNESRKKRVMIISILAGGTGISLHHGSSSVIICEPYYNPFLELQAEERVHRIGQTEQVNIVRFRVNNSIETWIDALKQRKNDMAHDIELGKPGTIINNISIETLSELFKVHVSFINQPSVGSQNLVE